MGTFKNYAQFNQFTVTGRVVDATVRTGKNGEFLVVTLISNITDEKSVTVKFLDSGDIFKLHTNGKLPVGRMVTVTGNLDNVSEFFETKTGELKERKRPELTLAFVSIPRGGLGALPKSEAGAPATRRVVLRRTAESADLTPESEYSDNEADAACTPVDEVPSIY